jgi:hypothetical protein
VATHLAVPRHEAPPGVTLPRDRVLADEVLTVELELRFSRGGLGDWLGRVLIGLGALLLVAVVGFLTIALVVLFVDVVS